MKHENSEVQLEFKLPMSCATKAARIADQNPGSGKSISVIKQINKSSTPVLVIVERQSEVDRYAENCPRLVSVSEHADESNRSRYQSLLALARDGESIVSTHQMMKHWTNELLSCFDTFGYELIMDETLSGVISQYPVKSNDLKQYVDSRHIQKSAGCSLGSATLGNRKLHSKYSQLEDTLNNKDCYLVNRSTDSTEPHYVLIETMPVKMFQVFRSITILTYLFEGSLLGAYFDLHGIQYSKVSLVDGEVKNYSKENGEQWKEKIFIYKGKLNDFDRTCGRGKISSLSRNWSEKKVNQAKSQKALRNIMYHYTKQGFSKADFLWTFHKDFRDETRHSEFDDKKRRTDYESVIKRPTLTDQQKSEVNFISQNMRGTNDFASKSCMAYLPNTFLSPVVKEFLSYLEVSINEDLYALSQLIQWLWRGCIRQGEPMHVFVPNRRMRHLLMAWLGYKPEEYF